MKKDVKRWPTIAVMVCLVGLAGTNSVIPLTINHVIEVFGLHSTSQGLMSSLMYVGGLVAALAFPFMAGRVKKVGILLASMLLQAVGLALCGISPSFVLLLGGCMLMGLGSGLTDTAANSLVIDINAGGGSQYMGMLHGLYGLGSILTPFAAQAVMRVTVWRNLYFIFAAFILLLCAHLFLVQRARRDVFRAASGDEPKLSVAQVKQYLGDKRSLLVVLCLFIFSAQQTALTVWLVRFMTVQHNAEWLGSMALSFYWVGSTTARFLAPRLPKPPLWLVGVGTLTASALVGASILIGNPVLMVVLVAASGLVSGHGIPMLIHECAAHYAGNTSLATSVAMLAIQVSMMLVPLLVSTVGGVSMLASMCISPLLALLTGALALFTLAYSKRCETAEKAD